MEPRDRKFLEIIVAAIFIILLVLSSVLIVGAYGKPKTTITNSYNTYSYNYENPSPVSASLYYPYPRTNLIYGKPYIVDRTRYRDYSRGYDRVYYLDRQRTYYFDDYDYDYYDEKDRYDSRDYKTDEEYLRYDDSADFRTYKGIVDNRVNSYEVYVRNVEYAGGYFKTIFYFEDYYGRVDSRSITHYIPAKEEKKFVLKDISPSRYDYRRWWYEVVPLTKTP